MKLADNKVSIDEVNGNLDVDGNISIKGTGTNKTVLTSAETGDGVGHTIIFPSKNMTVAGLDDITGGGGVTLVSANSIFNFGIESNIAVNTIASALVTSANIKGFSYIQIETSETSLDDFTLNGVTFNIENIIDNTSFDIRGSAANNATGNYTIKYLITI